MEKRPGDEVDMGYVHTIRLKVIRYVTLCFRDWRGAASLRYRNRATTTVSI